VKQFFINLRARLQLRNNKQLRLSIPYQQISSVGIIFSTEDNQKHESIKSFVSQLELDSKKVTVLEFLHSKKENYESQYDFFSIDDFSFLGKNNSAVAQKFNETNFDYLICLDCVTPHPAILQLLAQSTAHCRIGKYWESNKLFFDFMIDNNGSVSKLTEQINLYIRQLN